MHLNLPALVSEIWPFEHNEDSLHFGCCNLGFGTFCLAPPLLSQNVPKFDPSLPQQCFKIRGYEDNLDCDTLKGLNWLKMSIL